MKFKILVFSIALVCAVQNLYAQNSVGIGTETPNQNAVLELIAINGNQGFLAPRLTAAERTAFAANLTATDNGMLVFDSDDGTLYVWYNAGWNAIGLSQFVAGDGISIVGQEITNSGDIDATDDVTITTASAGDVLGRFDSLVVSGLKGLPLDSIAPSTGFSLVWNGSLWKFALDSASNQTVIPNANLLATNTQAALEELQVEILSITTGPNSIGSAEIIDGSIVDTDISATAAIAGTKVNPNFGAQNVLTTGTVTGASFSGDGSGLTNIPATPGPNTVGSPEVIDGSIADADVNAAAAIAGTKVTPDFGAQNISTTGSVTASSFSGDGSGLTNIPATPGPNTVSSAEVIDGSIAFSDLNTAVVDGVTLASNGSSFEVRDNGVTTAKLVNGSVTDAKVSDVAPAKITQSGATNGQVLKWTGSAWAPAADVTGLASLTNGTLLIGDGTNTPQEQVITGHITVDNTGIAQIQSAVITHDMVNDLSFVDGITLASNGSTFEVPAGGISSLEIQDLTISDIDISNVDAGKIIGLGTAATLNVGTGANQIVQLDGGGALPAVDGSSLTGVVPVIGAGTIGTTELANDAVTSAKITNGTITDVDISDVSAAKVTGLGTAATLDAGVTTNDLVQLPSDGTLPALDGSALVNMSAAQISGLGTAAALNVGAAANNVVQLDGGAKLPAVEGSQLTNVTAVNFTGALAGDVAGGQGTTIISNGAVSGGTGGKIADNTITDDDINSISTAVITGLGTAAGLNVGVSPGNVVQLDATGLPAVDGSQLTNVTATGFTGSLAGDVSGTQGATVVGQVGGVTAANVALGANAANAATALNTSGTIVARDGSGNFAANNITATSFVGDGAAITGLDANAINDMEVNATDNVVSLGAGGGKTAAQGGSAGTDNTFLGANAGQATSGNGNIFVGSNAGLTNTTGAHNVFIGGDGGTNTTGDFNTLIGDNADVGVDGLANATAIGAGAIVSQSNSIALGQAGTKVGIGQSTPLSEVHISNQGHILTDGDDMVVTDNIHTVAGTPTYTENGAGMVLALSGTGSNLQVFEAASGLAGNAAALTELMTIQGGTSYVTTDWTANNITVSQENSLILSDADNSANISLKAPGVVTASTTFTMPDGDGASGNSLVTDGSGNLGWAPLLAREVGSAGFATVITGSGAAPTFATGQQNAIYGDLAGGSFSDGSFNTYLGYATGGTGSTVTYNTFIGNEAGLANTANSNTFVGSESGYTNTSGTSNVFLGRASGYSNLTASNNTFLGFGAGEFSTGANNTFVGRWSGRNVTGTANVLAGINAGNAIAGGSNNVVVGGGAGSSMVTNSGNTILGSGANASDGLTNATVIGNNATITQSNSIVLGSSGTRVGVGTTAPQGALDVTMTTGAAYITANNNQAFGVLDVTNNGTGNAAMRFAVPGNTTTLGVDQTDGGKFKINMGSTFSGSEDFTITPTGNVGIGNTAPGEALTVNGNVQAAEYFYPSAVTKILSVSNKSFTPEGNEPLATQGGTLGKYIVNGTATVNATMSAGIELPNGATVTQVDAFVIDNDATYNVTVQLARGTHTATGGIAMTNVTSAGQNPAVQNLSETFINAPLIDNDMYFYYLSFQTKQANSNLALLSFRIYYTVQKVD
ncbi:MAG: hypothetical protein RIB71_27420 [Imperialibacter sp.]|uniref:beta strand repeat-containing protein n=1 Tax=Imperialibacter sp. TaxID=2038411 RepID=UPI0032EAF991